MMHGPTNIKYIVEVYMCMFHCSCAPECACCIQISTYLSSVLIWTSSM